MNREIIDTLSEMEFVYISEGVHANFSLIKKDEEVYHNHNDITIDYAFIVKRFSDGKFFKGRYTKNQYGKKCLNSFKLTEVFENKETKEITKITYE